ncbi:MAG: HYR domain-containing protein [Planctomycetota bacterium]|jgi:hypothetical protein
MSTHFGNRNCGTVITPALITMIALIIGTWVSVGQAQQKIEIYQDGTIKEFGENVPVLETTGAAQTSEDNTGSITIKKQTNTGAGPAFDFTGTLDDFSLSHNQSHVVSQLPPGDYEIREIIPPGWRIQGLAAGLTSGPGGLDVVFIRDSNDMLLGMTVHLAANQHISCDFYNGPLSQPPQAQCKPFSSTADDDCCINVTVDDIDDGSSDPDGAQDINSLCITAVDGNDVGCLQSVEICDDGSLMDHTVTLTITDQDGQSDSCDATVTISDNTPPAITCPPEQTHPADENCAYAVPDLCSLATITDNCDPAPACTQNPPAGTSITHGANLVTLTATDQAGNSSSCDVTITVIDTTPPDISCPPDHSIAGNKDGQAQVPDLCTLAAITDTCDPAPSCTQNPPAGTTIPTGDTLVILTATDQAGNASSCQVTITVSLPLNLDIKPGGCPNPLNTNINNKGKLPVAILGTEDFDVNQIDLNTISIAGAVLPAIMPKIEDVGTALNGQECECHELEGDGYADLVIHFSRRELILALGLDLMEPGAIVPITVEGMLADGTPFAATDCVILVGRKD